MNEVSKMCSLAISRASPNAISSLESEAGAMPFVSLDGPTNAPFGQARAHANLSARRAKELGLLTSGTFGPHSFTSLLSRDLVSSLVNRLRARMVSLGSTQYKLTWKERTTPLLHLISALRASAHLTSGNGSTLWPTPTAHRRSGLQSHGRNAILGVLNPQWVAWLMGYPTDWLNPPYERSETQSSLK